MLLIILILIFANFAGADQNVVATVNGVAITEKALKAGINEKLPFISVHTSVSEKRYQEIRQQVLADLIDEELFYQEAKRRKIKIPSSELDQFVQMMKKGYPSEKIFKEELKKTDISYKEWVRKLKRRLMIKKLRQQEITAKVKVTDQDVEQYYNNNKKKFIIPERLHLLHILISVDPGGMKAGWQEGQKKAEEIYQRIKKGEDFKEIAKQYSDDKSSNKEGGDIGWLHVGQLLPELDSAAKKMKIGEVSKPIRTIYGYHIIKLVDKAPGKQLNFSEINQESLKQKLLEKRIKERTQAFLAELKANADIRILEQ